MAENARFGATDQLCCDFDDETVCKRRARVCVQTRKEAVWLRAGTDVRDRCWDKVILATSTLPFSTVADVCGQPD